MSTQKSAFFLKKLYKKHFFLTESKIVNALMWGKNKKIHAFMTKKKKNFCLNLAWVLRNLLGPNLDIYNFNKRQCEKVFKRMPTKMVNSDSPYGNIFININAIITNYSVVW